MTERLTWLTCQAIRWHAHPAAQLFLFALCGGWFGVGLTTDPLTNGLSIWAMWVSMMILTDAKQKEAADARRDAAIQAKLDELVRAVGGARDELTRAEDRSVEEIEQLRS